MVSDRQQLLQVHLIRPGRLYYTMSKSGALDLASGLGGKIDKEEVKSAVDEYVPGSAQFPLRLRVACLCSIGYCRAPDDVYE